MDMDDTQWWTRKSASYNLVYSTQWVDIIFWSKFILVGSKIFLSGLKNFGHGRHPSASYNLVLSYAMGWYYFCLLFVCNRGKFFFMSTEFDKNLSDWRNDCTDYKNDFDFLGRFGWFLMLKIDFENQILVLFDGYFWPFKKSQEKSNPFLRSMQSYLQSEMFLSNSIDIMKNLQRRNYTVSWWSPIKGVT